RILLYVLLTPLATAAVVLLLWPLLWTQNPIQVFGDIQKHWGSILVSGGFFLGGLERPWYYLPVYALATTPTVVLIRLAMSVPLVFQRRSAQGCWILLGWCASNLFLTFLHAVQDGIRYALPCLVPMALLGGAGIGWATEAVAARLTRWRRWVFAGVGIA